MLHSNGNRIAGIVKPHGRTRLDVIDVLPTYLTGVSKTIVLMDQEDQRLKYIFRGAKKRLAKKGFSVENEIEEDRLKVYDCKFGGRDVRLILVINGLDEIQTNKHTIEDHLLKAAKTFGIEIDFDFENSKDAWKRLKNHEEIFKKLKERNVKDIFPSSLESASIWRIEQIRINDSRMVFYP